MGLAEAALDGSLPCVLCRIGGVLYGIPSRIVRESMTASAGISGEVPFQGSLFPSVDPRAMFGLEPADPIKEGGAVLLEDGATRFALLVDSLAGEVSVPEEPRDPLPWTFNGFERRLFAFLGRIEGGNRVVVFRPEGLFSLVASPTVAHSVDLAGNSTNAL